jgi:hypothetical protein
MPVAEMRITPEALAKLFGLEAVEHMAVRIGLAGLQTLVLKVRDPRIPKGVREIAGEVRINLNGSVFLRWRPRP